MRIWRCPYTGEFILGVDAVGAPIFGRYLPFAGWKWLPSDALGFADNETWPPKFVALRFGFAWLGTGRFFMPPWPIQVREIGAG